MRAREGEAVALPGRNSVGNSMTLRTIIGTLPVTSGKLVLDCAACTLAVLVK
jgi:branched-chain amino acid transport system ATP-binding protein